MTYNIDPAGVQGVLSRVAEAGETLGVALSKLADVKAPLRAGLESPLEPVLAAVDQFFERKEPTVSGMTTRVTAGLNTAATTTRAYIQGDDEMAVNTVSAAKQAVRDGNADYFITGDGRSGGRDE